MLSKLFRVVGIGENEFDSVASDAVKMRMMNPSARSRFIPMARCPAFVASIGRFRPYSRPAIAPLSAKPFLERVADVFAEFVPFAETHDYVKKILTYWWTNRYLWAR